MAAHQNEQMVFSTLEEKSLKNGLHSSASNELCISEDEQFITILVLIAS